MARVSVKDLAALIPARRTRLAVSTAARRPNSITRVLTGWSDSVNAANRSRITSRRATAASIFVHWRVPRRCWIERSMGRTHWEIARFWNYARLQRGAAWPVRSGADGLSKANFAGGLSRRLKTGTAMALVPINFRASNCGAHGACSREIFDRKNCGALGQTLLATGRAQERSQIIVILQ